MNGAPRDHIDTYIWEIGDGGRTAIIGDGNQWHVLCAIDTFATPTEAVYRLNEIERNFEAGKHDRPAYLTELVAAIDSALPFVRAVAPTAVIRGLEEAVQKIRPPLSGKE